MKNKENEVMKRHKLVSLLLSLKQIETICFAFMFSIFSINVFATGIDSNASSASCDNPTLGTYSGTSNLQANWQANEIGLAWYSDDTQITDVQSAATSCNYDGGLSVPSTVPTKTGYTFNGWKVRGLPEGYTRLQYIQSTGTQYIDTGLKQQNNDEFKLVYKHTSLDTTYRTLLGASASGGSNTFYISQTSSNSWVANVANKNIPHNTNKHTLVWKVTNTSPQAVNIDGIVYNTSVSITPNTSLNVMVFGRNASNGKIVANVYHYSHKRNGTYLCNFIPAKRNSDNAVGMYDTVSKTFFTNAGSGSFTAGPVVQ